MTKQQECDLLAKWIAQAPRDSYLATMLRHLECGFIQDTRSDFACLPDLRAIECQIEQAQIDLSTMRKEQDELLQKARSELSDLKYKSSLAKEYLAKMRTAGEQALHYLKPVAD